MADQRPRWRRRKDARPTEIVDAALELFAARGFAATRLEDVAERAGISKGTLYLYFPGKEALFKAVIQQELLPNLAMAETRLRDSDASSRELLLEVLTRFIGAIAGSRLGAIPKLVIAESGNFPDLARFYVDEVVSRGVGLLRAILERGIARGEFRAVDPGLAAPVVVGPLLLLALWKQVLEPHSTWTIDPGKFLETHADLLLNGLLQQPQTTEGGEK